MSRRAALRRISQGREPPEREDAGTKRLHHLLASDPFRRYRLRPGSKHIVTFFRAEAEAVVELPLERQGARLLLLDGRELFTAYVPGPKGAAFMALIERTFGKQITTRTWETVAKVARA